MHDRKECNERVAKNIKRIRLSKNLTQKQVADAINITPRCYCYYETAKRDIPLNILIRLSYLFNVDINMIVNYKDEEVQKI